MSTKLNTLRKTYRRNSVTHICFDGAFYAPVAGETEFSRGMELLAEPTGEKTLGDRPSMVLVERRLPMRATVSEVWGLVEIPRTVKAPKAAPAPKAEVKAA